MMLQEWHDRFRDCFPIGMPASDLNAAISAVINSDDVSDKRIICVDVMDGDHIFIKTGYVRGPLYGGGQDLLLARSDSGEWEIEEIAGWIS